MPGSSSLQFQCFALGGKYSVVYAFYVLHEQHTHTHTLPLPLYYLSFKPSHTEGHKSSIVLPSRCILCRCTVSKAQGVTACPESHTTAVTHGRSRLFRPWITDILTEQTPRDSPWLCAQSIIPVYYKLGHIFSRFISYDSTAPDELNAEIWEYSNKS